MATRKQSSPSVGIKEAPAKKEPGKKLKSAKEAKTTSPSSFYQTAHPSLDTLDTLASEVTSKKRGAVKSKIMVKYDVGFSNALYLRGKGGNLSWDKGTLLKNVRPDEWLWETDVPFSSCEFKVLINDNHFELGENHILTCGSSIQYTPKF